MQDRKNFTYVKKASAKERGRLVNAVVFPVAMAIAVFLQPPGNGRRTSTPTALEKPKSVPRKSWPRVDFPIRNTRSLKPSCRGRW